MNARTLSAQHFQQVLNGSPVYLGTIDCTGTSKTNAQATTPFGNTGDMLKGKVLLVCNSGSVTVYVHPVATSTGTTTAVRGAGFGVPIGPGERVYITMNAKYPYIAAITTTTANLDFWEMA
jgi:hypothetical protein